MFIPKNYNIIFAPDLEKFCYSAKEIITFDIVKEIDVVTLDSVGLEIIKCQLLKKGKSVEVKFDVGKGALRLYFKQPLAKGEYRMVIDFKGTINKFLAGWYRSGYQVDGKQKYMATTHFEPADARRVFPCIDNPSYKATFDIALKIDKKLMAISNMPLVREKVAGKNKKLVTFSQTPLMSTYLLYMGVGVFEFLESKYRGIIIRGVTTPGKAQYTKFAVDSTKKFLAYFEEYFDFKYPLPKIDLIGVTDFAPAGMEHWGAITFRENVLFYIQGTTSVVLQKRIAEVIAHELVHQWFGDLVTMKWWDDLWLNESFATFMAYKAVHHFWPEWHVWTDYLTDTVFEGMALDSLRNSHPIQGNVEKIEEINELFDEIAYDKGGSILRMLEEYLGHDVFRNGLRAYIAKYQYGNARGEDLWNTIGVTSQKPVLQLIKTFIMQTGFPSLFVNLQGATLAVRQERFSFDQNKDKEKWFVPLVVQDGKTISRHLLEKKQHAFLLSRTPEFVNINFNYRGFYITTYSNTLLTNLGKHMDKLHAVDRVGILHDLYYAVLAGRRTIVDFVDFASRYYSKEKDPTVLAYVLNKLLSNYLFLQKERLKTLTREIALRSLKLTGWQPLRGEDPEYVVLRSQALFILSLFNHKETLKFGREQFLAFLADEKSLHQDLRAVIYGLAVWDSDDNYHKVLDLYRKSTVQEERAKFLSALCRTRNETLIRKTMDYSLSKEVSYSNIIYFFAALSRNPYARRLSIDWLIANWDTLIANGGETVGMLLRRILKLIVPSFGIGREEEIRKFLNRIKSLNLKQTVGQVMEEMEIYSRFVKRNRKLI
ncbi:MAG: M1 family metallopeptidase [Patescibacteria group bacterium]